MQGKKEVAENGGDITLEPTIEEVLTTLPTCSNLCSRYGMSGSYESTTCRVGELRLSYGYPGETPLLVCCCYDVVAAPDNDGDGIPDSEDPDDDNDGFTDDEEIQEGTDPLNPNDYPGAGVIYTCGQGADIDYCSGTCPPTYPVCTMLYFDAGNYYACACINDDTQMVHEDWKPDGSYHNPQEAEPIEEGSTFCTDSDFHLGFPAKLEVKSSCQDSFGTYWDYCDGDLVHDWFCDGNDCSDALGQSCMSYVPESTCIDGACYKPPTEEEICAERCSNHGAPLSVTGAGVFDCRDYADSWCVINVPPEGFSSASSDDLCCCWNCVMD